MKQAVCSVSVLLREIHFNQSVVPRIMQKKYLFLVFIFGVFYISKLNL